MKKYTFGIFQLNYHNPGLDPVIYNCDELSFIAMAFPECMLSVGQKKFMFIQVCHNI